MRTGLLAVGGWLAAATVAVSASWLAVGVVGTAVAPEDLSAASGTELPPPDETATGSARPSGPAGPSGSAEPSRTPTPRPSGDAGQRVTFTGTGGSAVVECAGGRPRLVSVIPRIGFSLERDDSGAEVKFRSATHRTEMRFSCAGSVPQLSKEEKDEGGGGNDNSGSGGSGDSGRGGGDG